ncbi:tetratricopeptide repeat protein [Microbacterium oxydans]|uniref:tetratricopeptide repeat protein n=1 Tax=Microbacterium oxydans TaxID=82380 RepID=UPI00226B65EE|nr:tetratricopeptide repeat protein [Microbacterium oxydans]WAA66021.1 tetratricopeptide repeat protein [Microbacterium oxydans]
MLLAATVLWSGLMIIMDSIVAALASGLSATVFLIGFSSIRLRSERDRALNRSDAVFADLAKAAHSGSAISDAEVAAAADGLKEAETRDPIGRWTLFTTIGIGLTMAAVAITAGARSGLAFNPNPFAWSAEAASLSFLVVANATIVALGVADYLWVVRDLDRRLKGSPVAKATHAIDRLRQRDWEVAVSLAEELRAQLPSWPWVRAFLAHALASAGKRDRALTEIETARRLEPSNSWWNLAHVELLLEEDQFSDALDLISTVEASVVGQAAVVSLRGAALYGLGQREEAITEFNSAIRLDPRDAEHRYRRGRAIMDVSRHTTLGEPTAALAEIILDDGERVAVRAVMRAGHKRLRARDALRAVEDFTFALAQREDADTYLWRGTARYQANQIELAEEDFQQATALGAKADSVHRRRAAGLAASGMVSAAEEELGRAINTRAEPRDYFQRGMIRLQLRDFDGALQDLEHVLLLEPDDLDAAAHRAEALAFLKRSDESQTAFEAAVASGLHLAHTYEVWLQSLLSSDQASAAEAVVERALGEELDDNSRTRILTIAGSIYARLRLFNRALEAFENADTLSPGSPNVAYRRAVCHLDMGEPDVALELLDRAVAEPWSMRFAAYATRSSLHRSQGRFPAAFADIESALSLQPGHARLLVTRGCLSMGVGKMAEALTDLNHALELEPDSKSALSHRLPARIATGDIAGAKEDLERLEALKPSDRRILIARDEYWSAVADWPQVVAVRRQLLDLAPENSDAAWSLAAAYVNSDQPAEAEALFGILMSKDSEDMRAALSHAVAISMQGRAEEAQRRFASISHTHGSAAAHWMTSSLRPDLLPRYDQVMADWASAT